MKIDSNSMRIEESQKWYGKIKKVSLESNVKTVRLYFHQKRPYHPL